MRFLTIAALSASLALTGCGTSTKTAAIVTALTGLDIQGTLHGGQQPISGAHVYLLQANTTGNAGAGIAASTANASVSLLKYASTNLEDSIGAYVLTSATGGFSISGDYTCTPGTQVYLYALGGSQNGTANAANGMMAALGDCPTADNFASATPFIYMNEISTVAAAYAFAGFATDATHVSSSGSTLAQTGIKNAFANAANLASLSAGTAYASNTVGATVPQLQINSLANILASCINSTGPTSYYCTTLFGAALSTGTSGSQPTDTASAIINIAHNPAANVATLFGLIPAITPFAAPGYTQPNDFTITLNYANIAWSAPEGVAIDAAGNAWVTNYGGSSVIKLAPSGAKLATYSGNLSTPGAIAIDTSGNAWVASANAIVKINPAATSSAAYNSSLTNTDTFFGIAIDGYGDVWSADSYNFTKSTLARISSTGTFLSGTSGYSTAGLATPDTVAVDGGSNAWAGNVLGGVISKITPAGATASTANGFGGAGITTAAAIAVDASGNAWTANTNSTITRVSNTGAILSGTSGYSGGGINSPQAIAIDGAGSAWVANLSGITVLSSSGSLLSGTGGYTSPDLNNARGIAVDGSGNVWVTNFYGTNGLSELIGAAAPVITPIAAGLPATPNSNGTSTLGTRP